MGTTYSETPGYIEEVSLLCGDEAYKDFDRGIYETRLVKTMARIAKKYRILERLVRFENEMIDEGAQELSIDNYSDVFRVTVTKTAEYIPFDIADNVLTQLGKDRNEYSLVKESPDNGLHVGQYCLFPFEDKLLFDYKPKEAGDIITIWYLADACEEEVEGDSIPAIPYRFKDEIIEGTVLEIAKLGVVKYASDENKSKKYASIFKVYSKDPKEIDKDALRTKAPMVVKLFQPY